ncbi:MAG: HTH domain-containing protein [archaeon]|jgi:predicted transcriptional regulator
MKKLIIKIGGSLESDVKTVFKDPSKGKPGTHTLYLKNTGEVQELLSPKRLDLLIQIIKDQSKKMTIGELAEKLKRKREAISRDAAVLEKYGMIEKVKERQSVYLKPQCESVQIQFENAR